MRFRRAPGAHQGVQGCLRGTASKKVVGGVIYPSSRCTEVIKGARRQVICGLFSPRSSTRGPALDLIDAVAAAAAARRLL